MEFVQKKVFSNDWLSRDILSILDAVGDAAVKRVFENSKVKQRLVEMFTYLDSAKFVDLEEFVDYKTENRISFMSFEKAFRVLPHFEVLSKFYTNAATKKRKFYILLESLQFVESEMLLRMVLRQYDTKSVRQYLFPEPKKVKILKPVEEEKEAA